MTIDKAYCVDMRVCDWIDFNLNVWIPHEEISDFRGMSWDELGYTSEQEATEQYVFPYNLYRVRKTITLEIINYIQFQW